MRLTNSQWAETHIKHGHVNVGKRMHWKWHRLTFKLPEICFLDAEPEIRSALMKDGAVVTDLGNIMVDVRWVPYSHRNDAYPVLVDCLFLTVAHTIEVPRS